MRVTKKVFVCFLLFSTAFALAVYFGIGTATNAADPAPAAKASADSAAKTDDVIVNGRVSEVVLYRGQALVTRTIPIDGDKGSLTIVVSPLPEQVVSGSLFAEGTDSTQVTAVRYRTTAVQDNPNQEIREYDKAIEELNDEIISARKSQEVLAKRTLYLDQLDTGFVQPAAKSDLSRGVLDAKAVETITNFSFDKRQAIAEQSIALDKKIRELSKQLATKEAQRAELTKTTSKSIRQAQLFLEKTKPGPDTVRLNYLVSRCGWSPAYTFRAGRDRKEIAYEYDAQIQQMSGEAWEGVKLTLSTASPTMAAAGPGLGPFNIMLANSAPTAQSVQRDLSTQLKGIVSKQEEALTKTQTAVSAAEQFGASWSANTAANEFQALELTSRIEAWSTLQPSDLNIGEGTAMSYPPLNGVKLASRSDQQIVRVLSGKMPSKFYNVATPVLTNFVYREAELTNTSPEDLLHGTCTVYLDGRFVGRGEIPTVGSGQPFVIGLGVDPQVRAYRALTAREEKMQGANKQLNVKYQLSIENFKEEAITLRLYDRMPYYASNETEVRVQPGEFKDKLSDDLIYVRTERPKNILRWDLDIPAKATGEKVKTIDFSYTVEYPQSRTISAVGMLTVSTPGAPSAAPADLQQEFEQLQRARQGGTNMGGGMGGGGMGGMGGGRGGAAAGAVQSAPSGSRGAAPSGG
jgi:uncharacterized protein (TIGR02231 family)